MDSLAGEKFGVEGMASSRKSCGNDLVPTEFVKELNCGNGGRVVGYAGI